MPHARPGNEAHRAKNYTHLRARQRQGVGDLRAVGMMMPERKESDGTEQTQRKEDKTNSKRRDMVVDDAEHLTLRRVIGSDVNGLIVGPGKQGGGDNKIKADGEFLHGKVSCIQCTTVARVAFRPRSTRSGDGRSWTPIPTRFWKQSRHCLCTLNRWFCRMVCHVKTVFIHA
jgi:hypothetical protein